MTEWHWHELNASDIERAAEFYTRTFGWEAEGMEFAGEPYKMLRKDGMPIGGIAPAAGSAPASWTVFVRVADCNLARQSVIENGGQVHFGPTTIPGVGRIAGCSDPAGAEFTIIEPQE